MIKQIRIQNFKSIRDTGDIFVTKLFALIGKNNCGKSAIVDAIQAFFRIKGKEITERSFHKGDLSDILISVTLQYDQTNPTIEKYCDVNRECKIDMKCSGELKVDYCVNEKKLPAKDLDALLFPILVIPAIRNPSNETTAGSKSALKDLVAKLIRLSTSSPPDATGLEDVPAGQLSVEQLNLLLERKVKLQLKSTSESVSKHFQSAIGDSSLCLEIDPSGDVAKAISYSTSLLDPALGGGLERVDILACGTGLQSLTILALLQAYAQTDENDGAILLIEEPEVYLHPDLQRKMFSALRSIAKNSQVIYTTHSPVMISDLWADESVKIVKREGGETKISPIDVPSIVSELGIRYEDVLNPKAVVFVEGETDKKFYEQLAIALYPETADGLSMQIKFIPSDGYRNIQAYALMNILRSENVTCPFYIWADSDGLKPEERERQLLEEIKRKVSIHSPDRPTGSVHILREHELEGYFLVPEFLSEVIGRYPVVKWGEFVDLYRKKYQEWRKPYLESGDQRSLAVIKELGKPSILFEAIAHPEKQKRFDALFNIEEQWFSDMRRDLSAKWKTLNNSEINPFFPWMKKQEVRKIIQLAEPISMVDEVLGKGRPK